MDWCYLFFVFFFNDTATTEIYTLSLHDALPISNASRSCRASSLTRSSSASSAASAPSARARTRGRSYSIAAASSSRSEEHTSELQSRQYLVCRLLLEKKKKKNTNT